MIYYLITDEENKKIKISFKEPVNEKRYYGYDDFKPLDGVGDEQRDILSSHFLNNILVYKNKEEGDVIDPLNFHDEDKFLELLVENLKIGNIEALELMVNYYSSPCYPHLRKSFSDIFNNAINYLMTMYRSDLFRGTVKFANVNYTKSGENISKINILNLKVPEIKDIIYFCVENNIYIEYVETIFSYGGIENLSGFKRKYQLFNEGLNSYTSIPKDLFMILTFNKNINSELDLKNIIESYLDKSDEEKLKEIESQYDILNFEILLKSLYDGEYDILVKYADEQFNKIKNSEIYLPGDCEYHIGIVIDEDLAIQYQSDKLLTLFFERGPINRGPSTIEASKHKESLICYVNIVHGDDLCRERFTKRCLEVCSEKIMPYDYGRDY